MTLNNELSLEQIKDVYGQFVDDAVEKNIDHDGGMNLAYLQDFIGRIWLHQFLPNSTHLDFWAIESVRIMFNEKVGKLDKGYHNLDDCIALVQGKSKRSALVGRVENIEIAEV